MKLKKVRLQFRMVSVLLVILLSLLALNQGLVPVQAAIPSDNSGSAKPAAPVAAPPAAPDAVAITASKIDGLAVDNNSDGRVNPGDTISYTVTITNNGSTDATGVVFSDTPDPNTTLVPGSIDVGPIAGNDSYNAVGNTALDVGTTEAGPHVS